MKKVHLRVILPFILSLLSLSSQAWAERESGGGGAFVCRDKVTGEVLSSELLDLWEAREIEDLAIPSSDESVEAQITRAMQKMSFLDSALAARLEKEIAALMQNAKY